MSRHQAGSLTKGRGWRKTIGKRVVDGEVRPCRFWLGKDEHLAISRALQVEGLWMQQDGIWSEAALEQVSVILGMKSSPSPQHASSKTQTPQAAAHSLVHNPGTINVLHSSLPPQHIPITKNFAQSTICGTHSYNPGHPAAGCMNLHEAFELYGAFVKADKSKAQATKIGKRYYLKLLKRQHKDRPLHDIGAAELAGMVDDWRGRDDVAAVTIRNAVATLRQLFDWLDLRGHWEAPRRFERMFRGFKLPKPKIEVFNVKELEQLYAVGTERWRALILCGLNFGFANTECATFRKDEVNIEQMTATRERQKTGVKGQWLMWDATARLLAREITSSTTPLVFVSSNQTPLVRYTDKCKMDYMAASWVCLTKKAKIQHTPFKVLRKTGATMIRAIAGIEVSEQYLAHSEKTIARHYSLPSQSRLDDALVRNL